MSLMVEICRLCPSFEASKMDQGKWISMHYPRKTVKKAPQEQSNQNPFTQTNSRLCHCGNIKTIREWSRIFSRSTTGCRAPRRSMGFPQRPPRRHRNRRTIRRGNIVGIPFITRFHWAWKIGQKGFIIAYIYAHSKDFVSLCGYDR